MKQSVKIILIAVVALVVAAGLAALTIWVIIPAAKYGKAGSLADAGDIAGAYEAYGRMEDYRDAVENALKLQDEVIASRPPEGEMKFAGYNWLVLERRDGKALLLMKDILEMRPYHSTLTETDWENCTLRTWLNGAFYQGLPEADRARVAETALVNGDNVQYGTKSGGNTKDHVFLLSLAEANLYFRDDAARVARSGNSVKFWWLRSPGMEPVVAAIVTNEGKLGYAGSGVNYTNRGVRPAMWVTLPAETE